MSLSTLKAKLGKRAFDELWTEVDRRIAAATAPPPPPPGITAPAKPLDSLSAPMEPSKPK